MAQHQPILEIQNPAWILAAWAVYCGKGGGSEGHDAALGHGQGNRSTFPIQVYWSDVKTACANLCGEYSWDVNSGYLNRDLPRRHPFFEWMYVARVASIHPMVTTNKDVSLEPGPYPEYEHAILQVEFLQPHYPMINDQHLDKLYPPVTIDGVKYRQEWRRFCTYNYQPAGEVLQREKGQFRWAEGEGGNQPTAGSVFPSPTGQFLSKPDYLLTWMHVPYFGLYSPTTLRPEKILAAYGRVNSEDFMDYPEGTLLLKGWGIEFNEAPYPADRGAGGAAGQVGNVGENQPWPSLSCNVTLQFSVFDPPHAHSAYRGHNLAPHNDGSFNTESTNWYLIDITGDGTGARKFGSYDMRKIFSRSA